MHSPEEITKLLKEGKLLKTLQTETRQQKTPFDRAVREAQMAYTLFLRTREKNEKSKEGQEHISVEITTLRLALTRLELVIEDIKNDLSGPTSEETKLVSQKKVKTGSKFVNPFLGRFK